MKNEMSRDEHLDKIVDDCRELIELSRARYTNEWHATDGTLWCVMPDYHGDPEQIPLGSFVDPRDTEFIAAASRTAEAGWRATIAAIESCREIRSPDTGEVLDAIVAAWPEELL